MYKDVYHFILLDICDWNANLISRLGMIVASAFKRARAISVSMECNNYTESDFPCHHESFSDQIYRFHQTSKLNLDLSISYLEMQNSKIVQLCKFYIGKGSGNSDVYSLRAAKYSYKMFAFWRQRETKFTEECIKPTLSSAASISSVYSDHESLWRVD